MTSGSGFTADSGVPVLRGTSGLWRQYPALKKLKIRFEELNEASFFEENPEVYWYVYGGKGQS